MPPKGVLPPSPFLGQSHRFTSRRPRVALRPRTTRDITLFLPVKVAHRFFHGVFPAQAQPLWRRPGVTGTRPKFKQRSRKCGESDARLGRKRRECLRSGSEALPRLPSVPRNFLCISERGRGGRQEGQGPDSRLCVFVFRRCFHDGRSGRHPFQKEPSVSLCLPRTSLRVRFVN